MSLPTPQASTAASLPALLSQVRITCMGSMKIKAIPINITQLSLRGRRCWICGREDPLNCEGAGHLCPRHFPPITNDAVDQFMIEAALELYSDYLQSRRRDNQRVFQWSASRPGRIEALPKLVEGGRMPDLSMYSADQAQRIRDCLVVNLECEIATVSESDRVDQLFKKAPGSPVLFIQEIKYLTTQPHCSMHCVFWMLCKNGRQYFLDLTGKQFGPDWPLLAGWEYWGRIFQVVDRQDLGTKRKVWLEGWSGTR